MGECFNGDPAYVGPYQHYVEGLFNYPMYYTIRDIWQSGKTMYNIRNRYSAEASYFTDIDALGVFVDNHDNARFLNGQSDHNKFKSALVFSLTSRGIPFFYYGDEQGYAGGNDPNNREQLWTNMNTNSDLYLFT
jgi:alpha-amylase